MSLSVSYTLSNYVNIGDTLRASIGCGANFLVGFSYPYVIKSCSHAMSYFHIYYSFRERRRNSLSRRWREVDSK